MTLREPKSMEECFYFTNRTLGSRGQAKAWVYRPKCPKCGKGYLGKPVVKGKVQKRAKEYICPVCGYKVPCSEIDKNLKIEIKYTCPFCGKSGETTAEYKLKNFRGVKAYVFVCEHCGKKIPLAKKMKDIEGYFP